MMQRIAAKPFWARVALLGLGLYFLVSIAFLVGSLIAGDFSSLIFFVISTLPALLVAAFIIYFGSWAYIVGALAALFGLLIFGPSIPFSITSPDSFFDFFSIIAGISGLIMLLVGCVVTFFQLRGGNAPVTGSQTAVVMLQGVVAIIAVLSVMSALLTVLSIDKVSAADKEGAALVGAKKTEWNTEALEARSGGKIVVKNSDPILHTFTVKDIDIDQKIRPGSEKLIVLEGVQPGIYEFICEVIGHESMKGTLTIR